MYSLDILTIVVQGKADLTLLLRCMYNAGACWYNTRWLWLQAKRRVYMLQSGGKGAAGKRKRSDNGNSDDTAAGMVRPWLTHHCDYADISLELGCCCMACFIRLNTLNRACLQAHAILQGARCVGRHCRCTHVFCM